MRTSRGIIKWAKRINFDVLYSGKTECILNFYSVEDRSLTLCLYQQQIISSNVCKLSQKHKKGRNEKLVVKYSWQMWLLSSFSNGKWESSSVCCEWLVWVPPREPTKDGRRRSAVIHTCFGRHSFPIQGISWRPFERAFEYTSMVVGVSHKRPVFVWNF